jgi:hypothetical protein
MNSLGIDLQSWTATQPNTVLPITGQRIVRVNGPAAAGQPQNNPNRTGAVNNEQPGNRPESGGGDAAEHCAADNRPADRRAKHNQVSRRTILGIGRAL